MPAAELLTGNDDPRSHAAQLLDGIAETDWTEAIDMDGAPIAVPTTGRTGGRRAPGC